MKLPYLTLDVFTTTRHTGNPLAVVLLTPQDALTITQPQKQAIAREFNYSETIFIHRPAEDADSSDTIIVDIFTRFLEINFAGHPTIGSASYILIGNPWPGAKNVKALQVRAGRIPIHISSPGAVSLAVPHNVRIHAAKAVGHALFAGREAPVVSIVKGMTFILAQLPDVETLSALDVPTASESGLELADLDEGWHEGLVVNYYFVRLGVDSEGREQLRTRAMVPGNEDPATGSAASALTAYLSLREDAGRGAGPFAFQITQGVEIGRRSEIGIMVERTANGDAIESIKLSGAAVKVMEGTLEV
jgi:PhzF family phenazine biosynthesis protein